MSDTNWRSAEPIVRFNNDFFNFTARKFELQHPRLADVFDVAEAGVPCRKPQPNARKAGHVQLDFVAKDEADVGKDLTGRDARMHPETPGNRQWMMGINMATSLFCAAKNPTPVP